MSFRSMYIRTSLNSAQIYQVVAGQSEDLEGKEKGEVAGRPEDRKGYGLDAGDRFDQGGEAESRSCTERN